MKWKCNACVWGPCVYESASDDDYLMSVDICPRGACITRWQKMSVEEPEQKRDNGLPEWLRVGSFVWMDTVMMSIKNPEYQGVPRGIYKIIKIKDNSLRMKSIHHEGKGCFAIPLPDADEIQRLAMRQVFPQPYTFETAPEIIKVLHKNNSKMDVLMVVFDPEGGAGYTSVRNPNHPFIPFEDALKDYEQLDGWPCGTFDEEE